MVSVLSHKFVVFQRSQNVSVPGALCREYRDIRKERNAVMAHSVISRRARPESLLAVLRLLPMESTIASGPRLARRLSNRAEMKQTYGKGHNPA